MPFILVTSVHSFDVSRFGSFKAGVAEIPFESLLPNPKGNTGGTRRTDIAVMIKSENEIVPVTAPGNLARVSLDLEACGRDAESSVGFGRVCRIAPKANVLHQILLRTDGESLFRPAAIEPGKIPGVTLARVGSGRVERAQPESALPRRVECGVKSAEQGLPGLHLVVILLPRAAPGRPSPDTDILGEEITGGNGAGSADKIGAVDVHDFRGVAVAIEHFLAVRKERRIRQTVVFQDDGFLDERKYPIQSGSDPFPAAHVRLRVIALDLARPIDAVIDQRANLSHSLGVRRDILSWTVADDEQALGSRLANPLEHLRRQIGPIENNECQGCFHHTAPSGMA